MPSFARLFRRAAFCTVLTTAFVISLAAQKRTYVTNQSSNDITVIDLDANALIASLAPFNQPSKNAMLSDGSLGVITDLASLSVQRYLTCGSLPGAETTTGLNPSAIFEAAFIPRSWFLGHPFPNPAMDFFTFFLNADEPIEMTLCLIHERGNMIHSIFEGSLPPGNHTFTSNVRDMPAGAYFVCSSQGSLSRLCTLGNKTDELSTNLF